MQTNFLACALLVAACSTSTDNPTDNPIDNPTDNPLPGATNTPHMQSMAMNVACGQDVAFFGAPTPDLRYAFTYDTSSRLLNANGVWVESGTLDTTDYTWAGFNVTNILSTSGWDGSEEEISASYDATDNLLAYTYSITTPDFSDAVTFTFTNFIGPGQPTRQTLTQAGQPAFGWNLAYDSFDRLVTAVPDSGPSTTWTYNDVARTITVDTGNGAFVGVMTYDVQNRPISETYTGSDPQMIDYDETYTWSGNDLDTITTRSGSPQAPHTLEVMATATMRYNCATAVAAAQAGPTRFTRITPH